MYQENPPERVYFMILFNLFSDFLSEIDEDVLPKDRTGYQESLGSGPVKSLAFAVAY